MKSRLYLFPAVLPLVEIIPWLLAGVGTLAGIFFKLSLGKRWGLVLSVVSLIAVAVLLYPRVSWWTNSSGTKLTSQNDLPKLTTYAQAPPEKNHPLKSFKGSWNISWNVEIPRRALSNIVKVGGVIYFGTWDNTVDAYSAETGAPLWSIQKKNPVFALAAAGSDILLAGEGLHSAFASSLTAIHIPDGKVLWQREFKGHMECAPAVSADKKIWISGGPSGLWCVSAVDGQVLWHADFGHVDSTPLLQNGLVYFSSQPDEKKKEATLWALSQADGREQWSFPLPGQPWGSPEQGVDPETLLTTTGIGQVGVTLETDRGWAHALRKQGTKKLIWTHELPGNPIELGRVLRSEGLIFYVLTKGEVFALHANDGSVAWTKKLSGPVQADPVLIENPPTLITFENGGLLSAFGALDGKLIYSQKLPVGGSSAPLVVEDGFIAVTPYRLVRFQW